MIMVAEFLHYYPGYTVQTALHEYAVTFYALLSAMYRLKAVSSIDNTQSHAAALSGGSGLEGYLKIKSDQAGGGHKLLEEVKNVREARNV